MIGRVAYGLRFQHRAIAGLCQALMAAACWPAALAMADAEERRYVENQEVINLFRRREEARTAEVSSRLRAEDLYWLFGRANPVLLNPPHPYCRPPHFAPPPPYRACLMRLPR